jgi:tetratricopeptide (TPR) repeat protein
MKQSEKRIFEGGRYSITYSRTTYYYTVQLKLSKMKIPVFILILLVVLSIPGTAAHSSGIHNSDAIGNRTDTGTPADGRNQSLFADFFKNWLEKGLTLTDDGKYAEALQAFDNAFRYYPGEQDLAAKGWAGRARVYDALEQYDEALLASDEAITLSPDDPKLFASAWVTKGIALQHLGRYEGSRDAFDQALLIDPNDTRTRQLRVFTLRLLNADG